MNGDLPSATNVFAAALQWLQGTLLGTVATTVAVIAVASVGFLLMSGRVDMRRAAQVVLGCFILFGASSIVAGIMRVVGAGDAQAEVAPVSSPPPVFAAPATPAPAKAAPYDPYAGAAVPPRP